MAPKKDMKGFEGDGRDKAKWDDRKIEIFLKVCVEEILAGNRPSTHFNREGWKNLQQKFQERTRCVYDRSQLKNRWDSLKKEFTSFAKVVEKASGIGWNHKKNTVDASEQWWADKSKEDPEILKWKDGGPKFLELQEECFKGTVATGYSVLMPYQDPPSYEGANSRGEDIEYNEQTTFSVNEGDNYEVGDEVQTNAPSSSDTNLKKRKRMGKGDKKIGIAEKFQHSLDRIIDGMDQMSNTNVAGSKLDDPFSYDKCLLMLNDVPNLVKGTSQYFLAVRILAKKEIRIAFCYFMNNDRDMTIGWLNTFTEEDIQPTRQ